MADEQETQKAEEQKAEDDSKGRRPRWTKTKVPWFVMGGLALVLVVGGLVCGGGEKKKGPKDVGARAIVVPADRTRTVVVPACDTGVRITRRNAAEQIRTPGSTSLTLPRGRGSRAVIVPRCGATQSGISSSAYILPTGTTTAVGQKKGVGPPVTNYKLVVPRGSRAKTIVVPGCTRTQPTQRTVAVPLTSRRSTVAVAPPC